MYKYLNKLARYKYNMLLIYVNKFSPYTYGRRMLIRQAYGARLVWYQKLACRYALTIINFKRGYNGHNFN
jgi:hypothetical protein